LARECELSPQQEEFMKLSGEQFQQIIAQLTSDKSGTHHDKRQEPRVGVRAQGFITPWTPDNSDNRQLKVTIRDLSPAGISILVSTPMPRGMRFILRLLRFQLPVLLAHYEVCYSKSLPGSLFSIGAKLVNTADGAIDVRAA
jgi:hypothetical protein